MTSPFHAGGPLAAEDSLVYIERQGDVDALSWLTSPQQAADLLVVAPRQQGKTSCIYKLMRHPGLINYKFVYADLQNCNCTTEAEWYSDLWRELKPSYADLRNPTDIPVPANAGDWEDRMRRLAEAAFQTGTRLVIVLDEIDVMRRARTEDWSSRFFSTLRKLENARPINPALRSLYFAFIGAFHPRDLVRDESVSPFNIARRVLLSDFTATQVQSLVGVGGWPETQTKELAERTYYWTDGQPFLTQVICNALKPDARSKDVDEAVTFFRQSDLIHLPPIIKRLKADPSLMEYIRRIEADHRVPFSQQDPESVESKLELLGLIKTDSEGYCKVRNRLYREVLGLENHDRRRKRSASGHATTRARGVGPSVPTNTVDAYTDLRDSFDRGEITAFIGAGLSVGAGLPNWYDLISELARRIEHPLPEAKWANGETLIDAAQAYINQRSLYDLVRYLQERLSTTRLRPTAAHRALARLPISVVFTANYDDLLEGAYGEAGKQVHVVLEDGDIPLMRRGPDAVNIVKLYGDLGRWKSIVLARQQYESFFLQRPQMVKLLEVAMGQSTMLYLGWSHSDPHFNLVLGEQLTRFGGLMRPGYATMFDVTDAQRRELERKQVRLVTLPAGVDRTAQLAQWLESLAPAVDGAPLRAATPQVDAPAFVPELPRVEAASQQKPTTRAPRRKVPSLERREPQVLSDLTDLELQVELLDAQRTLKYTLHGGGYHHMDLGRVTLAAPPAEIIQVQLLRLSDLAHKSADRRTSDETSQAVSLLADIGSNLYEELFSSELKQEYLAIREKHAGKNLLITSDDPWIPWEIVRPVKYRGSQAVYDDPPLCEMFCLARWAKGRMAPSQIAVDSIAVVQPPADLRSSAQQEIGYFAGLAAQGVKVIQPLGTVPQVEASFRAGRVRLYHFACHGNFDLTDPNESKLRLADGFLRVSQITGAKLGGLQQAQPFVFLNACQTGETGFGLTRLGGWAPRFIESGVCAFIGSLWKINSELAARFAVEFYDRLLGRNNKPALTLGQAFLEARLAIKQVDPANPTWLAYALYGNPNARVTLGVQE